MQYILTEEEYDALFNEHNAETTRLQNIINDLCRRVAEHEPTNVTPMWSKDPPKFEPFGCRHNKIKNVWGYCDSCPVVDCCTLPKAFGN